MRKALRRALLTVTAVPAAALAAAALSPPAGAAVQVHPGTVGPGVYSVAEAAYSATGNTFRSAKADYPLPDPTQFAGSLKRIEFVSEMWSPTRIVMLGVWAATNSTTYHLEADVFNPATRKLICATWATAKRCPGTPSNWAAITFPAGHTAQLTTYFTQSTGTLRFDAADQVAGVTKHVYLYNYKTSTASFSQARLGAELGCTPWAGCGGAAVPSYTPPASPPQTLIQVSDCEITTSAGVRTGFGGAFVRHPVTMTATGTSTGTVEIVPVNLIQGSADNPLGQFDLQLK